MSGPSHWRARSARPDDQFRRGHSTIAAIDLGIRRDSSAMAVVAVPHGGGFAKLVHTKVWKPTPGREVDLQAVEDELLRCQREYGLLDCYFDPHQCQHLAQRLRRKGVRMTEQVFSAGPLQQMAEAIIAGFTNGLFALYKHADLVRTAKPADSGISKSRLSIGSQSDGGRCTRTWRSRSQFLLRVRSSSRNRRASASRVTRPRHLRPQSQAAGGSIFWRVRGPHAARSCGKDDV